MGNDFSEIQDLVNRPSESLSVELKNWIDPKTPEGQAKIIKGVIALRNFGGGSIIIGFNDRTLKPEKNSMLSDITAAYHTDIIQGLIAKHASEPFEVQVKFPEREGQIHPVIIVSRGVKTPVAIKKDLNNGGKKLIAVDDVYVRTLSSNNTPSTAKATWKDWSKILEICFENREADIGRFMRRHLSSLTPEILKNFIAEFTKEESFQNPIKGYVDAVIPGTGSGTGTVGMPPQNILEQFINNNEKRYEEIVKERGLELPNHGTWEVGLLLLGTIPERTADKKFLKLLESNNPNYTGWPIWFDTSRFSKIDSRPYVYNGAWEAFIADINGDGDDAIDFMLFDPNGRFYLRQALEDDLSPNAPQPLKTLDVGLPIIRTAEAIAVGIALAKAMGCNLENTQLAFAFKWTKLKGRNLVSWAKLARILYPGRSSYQDTITTIITLPLETPLSAINEYVYQATQPLFALFNGFSINNKIVEELTRRLLERDFN